jgi:hypothetical protein
MKYLALSLPHSILGDIQEGRAQDLIVSMLFNSQLKDFENNDNREAKDMIELWCFLFCRMYDLINTT